MNSSIINVSEILNSAKKFISAGFSGGYSFDYVNAEDYFKDLLVNSTQASPIFSGILILQKEENDFTIVDGLQRLTTISLLLCALCENYKNSSKKNADARDKIFKRFLVNEEEPKLKLTSKDQNLYNKILFSVELNEKEEKNNLVQAYRAFLNGIKKTKISGTELFRIISKIQFMVIVTDKSEVSTRELYQTLNTNKDESQVNLISDFICQKDNFAGNVWLNIVNFYRNSGHYDLLHLFVKDFLIIQNDGKVLNENSLYNGFKSYFSQMSKYQKPTNIVDNMCKYAQYYLKIIDADFDDSTIKEQVTTLNESNGKDSYPYLMEVLDDLDNSHITQEIFLEILKMINSFISQKKEGTISTFNFANLSKEINKKLIFKDYSSDEFDENKLTINDISNLTTFEV